MVDRTAKYRGHPKRRTNRKLSQSVAGARDWPQHLCVGGILCQRCLNQVFTAKVKGYFRKDFISAIESPSCNLVLEDRAVAV
jgi:hypothetical protein